MPDKNKADTTHLSKGVKYEYLIPAESQPEEQVVTETDSTPLADLMAKLKNM